MTCEKILSLLGEDVERYRIYPKGMWAYPKNGNGVLITSFWMVSYEGFRSYSHKGWKICLFRGKIKERAFGNLEYDPNQESLGRAFVCSLCENFVLDDANSVETQGYYKRIRYASPHDAFCDACLCSRFPYETYSQIIVPQSMHIEGVPAREIVRAYYLKQLERALLVPHQRRDADMKAALESALF